MAKETRKPIRPKSAIPIAETLATCSYSILLGFLRACHTLLHFIKNDFVFTAKFVMIEERGGGLKS